MSTNLFKLDLIQNLLINSKFVEISYLHNFSHTRNRIQFIYLENLLPHGAHPSFSFPSLPSRAHVPEFFSHMTSMSRTACHAPAAAGSCRFEVQSAPLYTSSYTWSHPSQCHHFLFLGHRSAAPPHRRSCDAVMCPSYAASSQKLHHPRPPLKQTTAVPSSEARSSSCRRIPPASYNTLFFPKRIVFYNLHI
jgi:hypothetical protein